MLTSFGAGWDPTDFPGRRSRRICEFHSAWGQGSLFNELGDGQPIIENHPTDVDAPCSGLADQAHAEQFAVCRGEFCAAFRATGVGSVGTTAARGINGRDRANSGDDLSARVEFAKRDDDIGQL
jgi:hypothetical protein